MNNDEIAKKIREEFKVACIHLEGHTFLFHAPPDKWAEDLRAFRQRIEQRINELLNEQPLGEQTHE